MCNNNNYKQYSFKNGGNIYLEKNLHPNLFKYLFQQPHFKNFISSKHIEKYQITIGNPNNTSFPGSFITINTSNSRLTFATSNQFSLQNRQHQLSSKQISLFIPGIETTSFTIKNKQDIEKKVTIQDMGNINKLTENSFLDANTNSTTVNLKSSALYSTSQFFFLIKLTNNGVSTTSNLLELNLDAIIGSEIEASMGAAAKYCLGYSDCKHYPMQGNIIQKGKIYFFSTKNETVQFKHQFTDKRPEIFLMIGLNDMKNLNLYNGGFKQKTVIEKMNKLQTLKLKFIIAVPEKISKSARYDPNDFYLNKSYYVQ